MPEKQFRHHIGLYVPVIVSDCNAALNQNSHVSDFNSGKIQHESVLFEKHCLNEIFVSLLSHTINMKIKILN